MPGIYRILLLLIPLLAPVDALGASFECSGELSKAAAQKILKTVERRYSEITTINSEFVQSSYFAGLERNQLSKGKVYFATPGKMDWHYLEPERSRFVASGDTIYFYQPEDNQVTIGDFAQTFSSDLPVSFLLGIGRVGERFDLRSACRTSSGVVLRLQPKKPDPGLEEFSLLVDEKEGTPLGAKVLDVGGNETTISLVGAAFNKELPAGQFDFEVPRGVDIIDRRAAARAAGPVLERELSPPSGEASAKGGA